jgi:hypothetical protein
MNKFLSAILLITLAGVSMNGLADDDDDDDDEQNDYAGKVVLCHKGKNSISVGVPGYSAHMAHGDTEGSCDGDDRPEKPPYSNGDAAVVTMQCKADDGDMVVEAFSSSVTFGDPPLSDIGLVSAEPEPNCAEVLAALLKEGFHVRSVTGNTDYLLLGETDDDS